MHGFCVKSVLADKHAYFVSVSDLADKHAYFVSVSDLLNYEPNKH